MVSKSRQQLELKAQKIPSILFIITSEDRGAKVLFHFGVSVCICLSVCAHVFTTGQEAALYICVCILFVDLSSAAGFMLQRTKAMFPIIVDFI